MCVCVGGRGGGWWLHGQLQYIDVKWLYDYLPSTNKKRWSIITVIVMTHLLLAAWHWTLVQGAALPQVNLSILVSSCHGLSRGQLDWLPKCSYPIQWPVISTLYTYKQGKALHVPTYVISMFKRAKEACVVRVVSGQFLTKLWGASGYNIGRDSQKTVRSGICLSSVGRVSHQKGSRSWHGEIILTRKGLTLILQPFRPYSAHKCHETFRFMMSLPAMSLGLRFCVSIT